MLVTVEGMLTVSGAGTVVSGTVVSGAAVVTLGVVYAGSFDVPMIQQVTRQPIAKISTIANAMIF